jgi:hypothetical protein
VSVRPSVEELVLEGKEIRVPSDTNLEHALQTVNDLCGTGRASFIVIEPGEHHVDDVLEVRVQNVTISGLSATNPVTDEVTNASVHGVWRLCTGSGGRISDLEFVNRHWDASLVSIMDGSWEMSGCKVLCGSSQVEKRPFGGYRLIYVSIHCHGGILRLSDNRIGGISAQENAYAGIVCSKVSQPLPLRASPCVAHSSCNFVFLLSTATRKVFVSFLVAFDMRDKKIDFFASHVG